MPNHPRPHPVLTRRTLLGASAAALAAPALAAPAASRIVRFVPFADLAIVDPIVTTTYVTRNHGYMVFDTLYGWDLAMRPHPQMAEGHTVEDDGRLVRIRLRPGLRFHDGEPVRAVDCVASIRRWAPRDALGQTLMARTEELTAEDDRTVKFRLSRPFPMLFDALAKTSPPVCFMMPARLAATDSARPITEIVGSGPFRFLADERVPGSRAVYTRFEQYVPRDDGPVEGSAGPKVVHVDRVEWTTIPDPSTAAAALQNREVDWYEWPTFDLIPMLARHPDLHVWVPDTSGLLPFLRFNHLQPPFSDPAMRRALLPAIVQADYLRASIGDDTQYWRDNVGFFPPSTPMASAAGMEVLTGPRDPAATRAALQAAGYRGEPVTLLSAQDQLVGRLLADVARDMLVRVGINVDYAASDWATLVRRRANRTPPSQGGWNVFLSSFGGLDFINPAGHPALRANGGEAYPGWPNLPAIEALRSEWLDAPDVETQKAIAAKLQIQAFYDLPYIPLGIYYQPTAHRRSLTGMISGPTAFWNLRQEG